MNLAADPVVRIAGKDSVIRADTQMRFHQPTDSLPVASPSEVVSDRDYTIGELAREFGLTLRALRFYEIRGLISPKRDGNMRLYSTRDRARVSLIVEAKALGFTVSEIKETLEAETRRGKSEGLVLSQAQVNEQIAHLERQRAEIDIALAELNALRAELAQTRVA